MISNVLATNVLATNVLAANVFGAIAYLAMAFAVNDLFTATEGSALGRRRNIIMEVVLSGALVQTCLVVVASWNWAGMTAALNVLAGICLLALVGSFWPVVARLKRGQLRVVNTRLQQRAARAEARVAAAHKWLLLAEQSGHVGHWQFTVPDNRLIWSDEMFRIHGLWREHYKPRIETALAAFHPVDGKRVAAMLQETLANEGNFEISGRLRRPDGEIRHVILRGAAALDDRGRVEALNGVMVDVTEPKRAEARRGARASGREIALEDLLTGLADRKQFDLSLGHEFKRAVRSRKPLGLVLLDIDHFRAFNDHYGTLEGDACLRAVAQAVQAIPRRTGDVVARYDEATIAVLLPLADAAGAYRVAGAMAEAVRALGLPNAGHVAGMVTVSCGAAAFVGMDDLYNPLELTRRAGRALAEAKRNGGNRVCVHHASEVVEAALSRL